MMFESLLIANRGEIACRVIRACRKLGIEPLAVFSEADQNALHVRESSKGFNIGPAPASQSYLDAHTIVECARRAGAQAIHPGYGFLAENDQFAELCASNGITFVGPTPEAIRVMGDKIQARKMAQAAGVPVIPGTNMIEGGGDSAALADSVGYPLVVKASGGGGGMGIQLAERPEDLQKAIRTAQAVGREAFGNDEVYLERFLGNASHIEVQVMGDKHGNAIHLFERDCSTQRRNQKIVEETPSELVTPQMRREICETALMLVRHMNYDSAGTVEFLAEPDGNFYFLEMNTRIQVEHPITELITGRDLVAMQIQVAAGEPLPLTQRQVRRKGHAMEARVLAEDSYSMVPSPGLITRYSQPAAEGIRVDTGVVEGSEISSYYDPLIAKVISWGETREEARRRLVQALRRFRIEGILTNIALLLSVLESELFRGGRYGTSIMQRLKELEREDELTPEEVAAIVALLHFDREKARLGGLEEEPEEHAADQWWQRGRSHGWWRPVQARRPDAA